MQKYRTKKMQKLECWLEILPISCCQKFPFLGPPKVLTASFLKSWSPFQFQFRFLVVLASLDFKLSLSKSLSEWFPFLGFSEKQEGGLSQSYFFVWWGFLASSCLCLSVWHSQFKFWIKTKKELFLVNCGRYKLSIVKNGFFSLFLFRLVACLETAPQRINNQ